MRKEKRRRIKISAFLLCLSAVSFITALMLKGEKNSITGSYSDTLYTSIPKIIDFSGSTDTNNYISDTAIVEKAPEKEYSNEHLSVQKAANSGGYYTGISTVNLLLTDENRIVTLPLEDYVAGATAAEMLPSASPEALRAQAVACRTLAANLILSDNKNAHNGADICSNPGHCQSYISKEQCTAKYANAGRKIYEKAEDAASATRGIILLYNSKPIVAAFHASSGEYTASSSEVWGGNLDYLVSVKTGEGQNDELKNQVYSSKSFTRENFIKLLTEKGIKNLDPYSQTSFDIWIAGITRTSSGRVNFMEIAGERVSGKLLVTALGLKSSDFSVSYTDDIITFSCSGYGHGVGMSQLGAETMAKEGSNCYEILKYYYPGVSFGIIGE